MNSSKSPRNCTTPETELKFVTGPLQGKHDPVRHGAALFAFFAAMAESERDYIREKTLEGQQAAAARGNHGGQPKVINEDDVIFARATRPSVASLYPALADNDA